jgi:hypothetical protein
LAKACTVRRIRRLAEKEDNVYILLSFNFRCLFSKFANGTRHRLPFYQLQLFGESPLPGLRRSAQKYKSFILFAMSIDILKGIFCCGSGVY